MVRTDQASDVARTRRSPSRPAQRAAPPERVQEARPHEGVTLTIPQPIVDITMAPFAIVGRVLPARKGLPLYAGLGVLAIAQVLEWPVAVGIGVGYAAIRRWGPQGELAARAHETEHGGRSRRR
ncbi:hypothetical protein ACRYCC_33415 [Actinomadura scrupuli]|uniref:hypothetical protein n=1 Tax=Actinomadura scrupuli TaxID=559629 RepID=UPI003D96AD97